jgi:hypothetical protein
MNRAPSFVTAPILLLVAACSSDAATSEANAGRSNSDASASASGSGGGGGGTGGQTGGGGGGTDLDASPAEDAGSSGDAGAGGGCTVNEPTADPSESGPYEVIVENNVGPGAGVEENGAQPHFTLIRPTDLTKGGGCHPVITWGNGYGDNPPTYMVLLKQLASHGFVVIASLSRYVGQGDPPPMKVGIDWILQQNDDPASIMYKRIDTAHVGATGHSFGGFATSQLGSDPRVKAIATLCGAAANANLRGPALLLCGGKDTVATCSGMQSALNGMGNQPVMLANQLTATHGSWIGSIKDPFMIAVTGWMRLHLMGDTAHRKMFYGADCELCTKTSVWSVQQKSMD